MSGGDDHAVVWQNLEVAGAASEHLCLADMKVPDSNDLRGVESNSRGLENLSVETMHHLCRADQMWGGIIDALELWAFLL
eukprot:1155806-Pelagomonas_calceolata.AAC.1